MSKKSRQKEALALYRKGFSQVEIADILDIHQSTVSRYFTNPSAREIEDFYEHSPYGVYTTKSGTKVLFNRRYRPLSNKNKSLKNILKTEWFYNDSTPWADRFYNSQHNIVIHHDNNLFN